MDIGARIFFADATATPFVEWGVAIATTGIVDIETEVFAGVTHQRRSMPPQPCRADTVKHVDTPRHPFKQIVDIANPQQVPWFVVGHVGHSHIDHVVDLGFVGAE